MRPARARFYPDCSNFQIPSQIIDAPDDALDLVALRVGRGVVQRNEGREGPVHQPGRQVVVLHRASQFQTESSRTVSRWAYFRKFRNKCLCVALVLTTQPHEAGLQSVAALAIPRKAELDR